MKIIQQILLAKLIEGLTQANLKNKIIKSLRQIKNKLKFYQVIFLSHNQKYHVFLSNKIRILKKHFIKLIQIMTKYNNFRIILTLFMIIKTEFIPLTIEDWSLRTIIKQINLTKN